MKIVINTCYGGFSLSHEATVEIAKRHGTPVYAFVNPGVAGSRDFDKFVRATDEEASSAFITYYRTSPEWDDDGATYFSSRDVMRDDPDLIALIDEWGSERVSGKHAELEIIEIPDGVDWQIEECEGREWVAEKHRVWP